MNPSEQSRIHDLPVEDPDTEAKIAEIEAAVNELLDLCDTHEELMTVLRHAIASKHRENQILAALDQCDESTLSEYVSEILDKQNPHASNR